MTLVSALSTFVAYLIPILSFNKFFNGMLYPFNGLVLLGIIILINILSLVRGDRLVNSLLLFFSFIAILIFTFPIWRPVFLINF